MVDGELYGVPFQNSTPLLYINAEQFKEAGLDPEQAAADLGRAGRRRQEADQARRRQGDPWGFAIPCGYDYCGWMMEALSMSNGGRYYNEEYGGEVYYDTPSMLGALHVRRGPGATSTR